MEKYQQWQLVSPLPYVIETEMVHLDLERDTEEDTFVWNSEKRRSEKVTKQAKGFVIFRAIVRDGKGGIATGTKSEKAASFPDFIEKSETGAIGRALAALGYGTQFAPELSEAHRIVDSPVDRQPAEGANDNRAIVAVRSKNGSLNGEAQPVVTQNLEEAAATEQQLVSIRKLCEHLGKPEPENITSLNYLAAKQLISQFTAEYRERRRSHKAS